MKKLFIFIMMLCMVFTLTKGKSYAQIEELPVGRNYLDVTTLFETSSDQNVYQSDTAFKVNNGSTYTLVMSRQVVTIWYDQIEDLQADITLVSTGEPLSFSYQKDTLNERVYIEFIPNDEHILIEILHLDAALFVAPYEIILYEGTYEDFFGYEPYINPDEVLKYYGQIKVNFDEPLSTETISTYINAQTPEGVNLNKDLANDTYTGSDKLPGTYELTYEATHNNITKQYFLSVIVEDLTAPVLSISEPIRVPLSNKVDVNSLRSQITVTDNVDILSYQHLTITHDTYTAATTIGTYEITVEVTDFSLNKTSQTFNVELYDNQGPEIKGPSQLYLYVGDEALTDSEILSYYKITDDVGVNTSSIQISHDEYVLNPEPGIYLMTISAKDTAGNTTTKDIHIHVIDNRGPEFHVNDTYIITTTPTEIKSESDIITWLSTKLESEGVHATNISIDHNEYELRASKSGSYYVYMNYQVDDQTYQTRVLVDVVDETGFNLLYLLGIIPICGIITLSFYIYRKRKLKI
jgi:hypothetical protein